MRRYIVDASVVIKWFVPEVHAEAARRLLDGGYEMEAPDLARAEVGNVLWKKWRRGELSPEAVSGILRDFERLPLKVESSESLLATAWDVTRRFDRSFCDGLYVALAVQADCPLVTADRKLYNSLRGGDLAERLVWVEELDVAMGREEA